MAREDLSGPSVRLWWATIAEADLATVRLLDPVEQQRLAGIAAEVDRARFLLGVTLLRRAAGAELRLDPATLVVDRRCGDCGGPHGRPVLPGHPLHASVSHSGLLVAVALADVSVGVDVERLEARSEREVLRWVQREARTKAATADATHTVVRPVPTPLPNHRAAVAVAGELEPRVVVRNRRPGRPVSWSGSDEFHARAGSPRHERFGCWTGQGGREPGDVAGRLTSPRGTGPPSGG